MSDPNLVSIQRVDFGGKRILAKKKKKEKKKKKGLFSRLKGQGLGRQKTGSVEWGAARGQPESARPVPPCDGTVPMRDACGGLPRNPHLSACLIKVLMAGLPHSSFKKCVFPFPQLSPGLRI